MISQLWRLIHHVHVAYTIFDFVVDMNKSPEELHSEVDLFINFRNDVVEMIRTVPKKVKSVVGNLWRKLTGEGPKSE